MGPVYQNMTQPFTECVDSENRNFICDAEAPVYIVEGSAGNNYYMDTETCTYILVYTCLIELNIKIFRIVIL